jgi:tetratricopeptide (TPR) repeat protein
MLAHLMRWKWIALTAILFAAIPATAQFPDKFTNLKVLPKDISPAHLQDTMRGFAFALNVRCQHCHVEKPGASQQFDFPADDKDAKKTARLMLQMVEAINRDYVAKVEKTDKTPPIRVECVTCHHGLTQPQPLNAVLAEAVEKKGIAAAVALYQELRKQYYGSGQYDFSETPLNQLTESLLAQKKYSEALAIMEMNFASNSPQSMWAYHMLAMTHQANGQIDKAVADYRKALELHPEDTWAKKQIDSLSGTK